MHVDEIFASLIRVAGRPLPWQTSWQKASNQTRQGNVIIQKFKLIYVDVGMNDIMITAKKYIKMNGCKTAKMLLS